MSSYKIKMEMSPSKTHARISIRDPGEGDRVQIIVDKEDLQTIISNLIDVCEELKDPDDDKGRKSGVEDEDDDDYGKGKHGSKKGCGDKECIACNDEDPELNAIMKKKNPTQKEKMKVMEALTERLFKRMKRDMDKDKDE
ncbi:MAG: hypothetical protein EOO38_09520 [Cytophagaceae bacterium]|nr:MAG: hypothetical protein EOO38_09520 [Cytophagaceae bacterium]